MNFLAYITLFLVIYCIDCQLSVEEQILVTRAQDLIAKARADIAAAGTGHTQHVNSITDAVTDLLQQLVKLGATDNETELYNIIGTVTAAEIRLEQLLTELEASTSNVTLKAVVVIKGNGVTKGVAQFQQTGFGPVIVSGNISGLAGGNHGFHIHQYGDLSDGCTSAGAHFNPYNHDHGAPTDTNRHVGDLGNVVADADGVVKLNISDTVISLFGNNSIVGRAVVIHADPDDLGRGNSTTSKTTGNAGARLACGVIGLTNA